MKKVKVFVCVLVALITLVSTACSASQDVDTQFTTKYCEKNVYYPEKESGADDFCFTELIGENIQFEKFNDGIEDIILDVDKGLYDYLVKTYDLNWEYYPTEVYAFDFAQIADGEYAAYAAMADPDHKKVYVNSRVISDNVDFVYRLAHEFIHCQIFYNKGSLEFLLKKSEDSYLGYYVGEAFTDLIAADYLETLGEKDAIDYFLNGSGYCYTVVALQVLNHSIPDMKKMYLNLDIDSFHQKMKELGEKHIVDGDVIDYGEMFLYQSDVHVQASQATLFASSVEEQRYLLNYALNTMFGNFEIVLAMSDGLDSDEELQVLNYVDHVYELEGDTGQMDKYLEHLKSCLD